VPRSISRFAHETELQKLMGWLRLEGTTGGHLVEPPLLKQGQLEQVAQDHVQTAFEYLRGWRVHSLPG